MFVWGICFDIYVFSRNFKNRRKNNSLHSIETELVAFAGTIIHFKFEFTAKA